MSNAFYSPPPIKNYNAYKQINLSQSPSLADIVGGTYQVATKLGLWLEDNLGRL